MISPAGRGLAFVHIAGARIGNWQGCVSCHQTFPTGVVWWPPGAQVSEQIGPAGRAFVTIDETPLPAGTVYCPGAN